MPESHFDKQNKIRFAQNLALTGYFLLIIILMINIVWLIPSRHFPTALVLLIIAGPLLLPMQGLLNSKTYTYQWASFLSLPYFAHGISEITAYPDIWYAGLLETLASTAMYLGCVLYARIFKQEAKLEAARQQENKKD